MKIEMDNDAFAEDPRSEMIRILEDVKSNLNESGLEGWVKIVKDINGNTIGRAYISK